MPNKKPAGYLVLRRTSTRKSIDPDSAAYSEWVNFAPGSKATRWPDHAPVAEWVASGHWKEQK